MWLIILRCPKKELEIALRAAVRDADEDAIETSIEMGVEFSFSYAEYPLIGALRKQHFTIIQMCLDAGADPNSEGVLEAVVSRDDSTIELLTGKGADIKIYGGKLGKHSKGRLLTIMLGQSNIY